MEKLDWVEFLVCLMYHSKFPDWQTLSRCICLTATTSKSVQEKSCFWIMHPTVKTSAVKPARPCILIFLHNKCNHSKTANVSSSHCGSSVAPRLQWQQHLNSSVFQQQRNLSLICLASICCFMIVIQLIVAFNHLFYSLP